MFIYPSCLVIRRGAHLGTRFSILSLSLNNANNAFKTKRSLRGEYSSQSSGLFSITLRLTYHVFRLRCDPSSLSWTVNDIVGKDQYRGRQLWSQTDRQEIALIKGDHIYEYDELRDDGEGEKKREPGEYLNVMWEELLLPELCIILVRTFGWIVKLLLAECE